MFGERVDLAVLSGQMALPGLTSDKTLGKVVLVVWLCDCRWRCFTQSRKRRLDIRLLPPRCSRARRGR
ncbi:MAG: hypothetical protein GDA36_08485 [Rhodobacteraceae bacterium]|nr:hypothetical protein [Paracoccaceae bacterium]